jgi:hypothetical protein
LGSPLGVLIEDFIKIAKPKEQEGIISKFGTDFMPLLHHGCYFLRLLGGHTRIEEVTIIDINGCESKANFLLKSQVIGSLGAWIQNIIKS